MSQVDALIRSGERPAILTRAEVCGGVRGRRRIFAMSPYMTMARTPDGSFGIWNAMGGQPFLVSEGTDKGWRKAASSARHHRESAGLGVGVAFPLG